MVTCVLTESHLFNQENNNKKHKIKEQVIRAPLYVMLRYEETDTDQQSSI